MSEGPVAYPVRLPRQYAGLITPVLVTLGAAIPAWLSFAAGDWKPGAATAALSLACAAWAAFLLSQRQVVTAEAVETGSMFGAKRMLRQDIAGYRDINGSSYGPPSRLLVAREGGQSIRIPRLTGGDHVTWIDALPDLDRTEKQAAQAALEANPAFGPTVEIRRVRIKAIRWVAVALTLAGAGASYICIFWPAEPHALIFVAVAAPLLAMAMAFALSRLHGETLSGQRIEIDTRWLVLPSMCLFLTGLGLGIRVSQLQLLDGWRVVEMGLLLALPVAGIAMWQDRRLLRTGSMWMPLFVVAGAIGWAAGTTAEINLTADRGPPRAFVTRITDKHIAHHRRSADSYRVTLAPWSDHARAVGTDVSPELYATLQEGEPMCVNQHPGALGFPWFDDRPCPTRGP